MDPSLVFRIKQLKGRRKKYDEIASLLHVGYSTISKALKKAKSTTLPSSTVRETSSFDNEASIYRENPTLPSFSSATGKSREGVSSNASADGELVNQVPPGPGFLENLSDELTPCQEQGLSVKKKFLLSSHGKVLFVLIGLILFIWILMRMREGVAEDE
jgi:hypothetical protein